MATGIRPWLRDILTERYDKAKTTGDDNLVAQLQDQADVVDDHQRDERPAKRAPKGAKPDRRCKVDREPWPCEALRKIAVQFSDRPGYKQEWRPRNDA